MIDAPERIWAWAWNTPAIKSHKTKCWCDYEPVFKDWVLRGLPSKKHWFGALTVYNQTATEYTRADIHDAVIAERDALAAALTTMGVDPDSIIAAMAKP